MRQVGAAYGALVRGLQQAAESFAQGFQEAMGR